MLLIPAEQILQLVEIQLFYSIYNQRLKATCNNVT